MDSSDIELRKVLTPPPARSAGRRFWEGFTTPIRGWRFIVRHRSLWSCVVLPIVINLLVTLLMFALLAGVAIWFIAHIHPWFHGWSAWWAWLGVVLEIAAALVVLFCAVAGTFIVWLLLSGILCSVFYFRLARQTELLLGARADQLRESSALRQVAETMQDIAALVAYNLVWLIVGFVPLAGPLLALVGSGYMNGFLLGCAFFGFPLALRAVPRRRRLEFCRRHRMHTLGLGAGVLACQFIPFAGAVLLAGAVAGSVLLHRRLLAASNDVTSSSAGPQTAFSAERF